MRILFMRHAIAKRQDPHKWENDLDRPLRKKGIKKLRKISYALPVLGYPWDALEVWVSPAKRCTQTAEYLKEYLQGTKPFEIVNELNENMSPSLLIEKIRFRSSEQPPLLLIGHGLNSQKFLPLLLTGKKNKLHLSLKKSSLVEIEYDPLTTQVLLLGLYPPKALIALAKLFHCDEAS